MSRSGKSSEGSEMRIPANLIPLALALIGGALLVSHKLTSDRPRPTSSAPTSGLGIQRFQTRLWEDPFRIFTNAPTSSSNADLPGPVAKAALDSSLQALASTGAPPISPRLGCPDFQYLQQALQPAPNRSVQLLGVMVSGGPYAEDRESRIRSRYAVVSAFSRAGYAPVDAEHLGGFLIPWPSDKALTDWMTNGQKLELVSDTRQVGVSYEVYRQRTFARSQGTHSPQEVVVLWLDNDLFEGQPLVRLPLLFSLLAPNPDTAPPIALLGPRRSTTLRAMLPGKLEPASLQLHQRFTSTVAGSNCVRWLGRMSLHLASPVTADEFLVHPADFQSAPDNAAQPYAQPRRAVLRRLQELGFPHPTNWVATEKQIAQILFDELELRGFKAADPRKHIALISEWDTFYGRCLSQTYEAELLRRRTNISAELPYLADHIGRRNEQQPPPLHLFSYLRGIDGEAANRTEGESNPTAMGSSRWATRNREADRPEGSSQVDYLARLGSQLESLDAELRRQGGELSAVGIVGGDTYDVMLILQALRHHLPQVIFFTSDLDARMLEPRELGWTQNLITGSSYGFTLAPKWQTPILPFRDSAQTAQYAAMLGILGVLPPPTNQVNPRLFEIGRFGAVDLSTLPSDGLHPPRSWESATVWPGRKLGACFMILLGGLALVALLLPRSLRPNRWDWRGQLVQPLWYKAEDLGGPDGAVALARELERSKDPFADWLRTNLRDQLPDLFQELLPWALAGRREAAEGTLAGLLNFLNRLVADDALLPGGLAAFSKSPLVSGQRQTHDLRARRQLLDEFLNGFDQTPAVGLTPPVRGADISPAAAAVSARAASLERHAMFGWERLFLLLGVIAMVLMGGYLLLKIWQDTQAIAGGEPWSFTNGTSAWPTEVIRALAAWLAVAFMFVTFFRLRSVLLQLTREYRLVLRPTPPLFASWGPAIRSWVARIFSFAGTGVVQTSAAPPGVEVPEAEVDANDLWWRLQQALDWRRLLPFTALAVGAYMFLAFGVVFLDVKPVAPIRGAALAALDQPLIWGTVIAFLFLAFTMVHISRACRSFIQRISEAPTCYPRATALHFSQQRGELDPRYLDEWLDVRLIADLTDAVGRLLYLPFIVFLFIVAARNSWLDRWPMSAALAVVLLLNLLLALASVWILNGSAKKARELAIESLESKIRRVQHQLAKSPEEFARGESETLVDELRNLRRGAFVPFWDSPILGAILFSSGGAALLEGMVRLLAP